MASGDDGVRYRGKVTIVTGGSQGIGRGCVELFAKHGSTVIIADVKEDLGKELEKSLNEAGLAGNVVFIKCDVMKEDEIKNMIETTVDKFGRIDCLINNVGTNPGVRLFDTCPVEEFRWVLDINLVTPFHVSKYAIKYLREVKGNIINLASMSGVLGQGAVMPYTAAKAGIIGLTKAMAVDESKNGVRVNCVSPGPVETPLFTEYVGNLPNSEKITAQYSIHTNYMGRIAQPVDVARACLYLATDATYSTGQNVFVSGGGELDYGFKANMDFFYER